MKSSQEDFGFMDLQETNAPWEPLPAPLLLCFRIPGCWSLNDVAMGAHGISTRQQEAAQF